MKRQITIAVSKDIYDKLVGLREKTGLPISKLIDLKLKGYGIKNTITEKFIW